MKAPSRGSVEIRIYGNLVTPLAMANTIEQWQQRWDNPTLQSGTYTIVFHHPGGSHDIDVDAIIGSEPENIAPAEIFDLSAASGAAVGSVSLNWMAHVDDNNTGTASSYTVGYFDSAIDS